MCGRYAIYGPRSISRAEKDAADDFAFPPRYNVAPAQMAPVMSGDQEGRWRYQAARWGLLPSWVKDPKALKHPINAKSETAAIKPMFRHAFRKNRVLVPADAFYEWKAIAGGKWPFLIRMRDESQFAMAGLLERWPGPEGEIRTFAILTTEPNALVAEIHDRMPAIIRPENYAAWLDPSLTDVEVLQGMLGPYPERLMETYPVSKKVNAPANDLADLVARWTGNIG